MRIVFTKSSCARLAISIATVFVAGILPLPSARAQQSHTSAKPAQTAPAAKSTKSATSAGRKTQSAPARGATRSTLATDKQKDSYALGMNVGRDLSRQPVDIDVTPFLQGMRDALEKNKSQLTDDEIKAALAQLQSQANVKAEAENKLLGEVNLKQGDEFLATNKANPGIVALPSGLQYKVVTHGLRSEAYRCRYGRLRLSRHAHQWQGV